MNRNDILFTRQPVETKGELFKVQLVKKGSRKGALPAKVSDKKLQSAIGSFENTEGAYDNWTSKYGGYNSLSTSYFAVIKHEEKSNKFVSFVPISMIDAKRIGKPEALLKYCTTTLGLINPTIVRSKLLINTQLKIDGYLFAITGKTEDRITLKSNVPLLLDEDSQRTLKKLESFNRKKDHFKGITINSEHDGITEENISSLYEALMKKSNSKIFSIRPASQAKLITERYEAFKKLSLQDKCSVVTSLLNYFGMTGGLSDLKLLGGKSAAGAIKKPGKYNIANSSIKIVDQSITGLFEEIEEIKA